MGRVREFFSTEGSSDRPRHGKYEIVRELGRGGMAVVYEAVDPDLRRSVALKVLEKRDRERLCREASAAARLRHPNIVTIHEVGDDFIAMERVEGKTLAELMPGLDSRDGIGILEKVARAVAHAHEQGVVHRDLKPSNILVEPGGRPVITDFGLARIAGDEDLTRTGAVVGTPHYMSPEQVRGARAWPQSDVWSLGVILYELLMRRRPFEGETALAIYDAIVRQDPPAPAGPAGPVAMEALQRDTDRRTASASALADDLGRLLRGEPVRARPEGFLERARRGLLKHSVAVGLGAAALFALAWAADRYAVRSETVGQVLPSFRGQARVALEAALELRRAGANDGMRKFLPPLEEAYRSELAFSPDGAEPEYLMGRMHRALLDEARALEFQEKALAKDPAYAPALYERAVLLSMRHARETKETLDALQGHTASGDPMESPDSGLVELGERIVRDARAFLAAAGGRGVESLVAEGLVAAHSKRYAEARAAFDSALRHDPLLEEARGSLAAIVWSELAPGVEDRERAWKKAEEVYTQGLERDQGYVPHYLGRGQLHWSRGSARRHRGLDPMPDYRGAEADFSRAIELDPVSAEAWAWRGQVRVYHGIFALERGEDPRPALARAGEDCGRAVEIDPLQARAWFWRGNGAFYRAVWLAERGQDPIPDLEAAERDQTEAIRLTAVPDHERRWRGRARAQRSGALARAGKDPAPVFAAAEEDFAASAAIRPPDTWFRLWKSTIDLERGLWKRSSGGDPREDFAAAERELDLALGLNRHFGEAWRQRGLVRWHRAETLERAGDLEGAADAYAASAADFHEALSINANFKVQVGDRLERARRKAAQLKG